MSQPRSSIISSKQMLSIIHFSLFFCFILSLTSASLVRSKKRKASTVLQDERNDVEDVQPVNINTVIQGIPQLQPVLQEGNVIYEPFKVLMDGNKSFHFISLSQVFIKMAFTGHSSLFSNIISGDHVIGLCIYCTNGMLSMRLSLSSFTTGQITVRSQIFMITAGGTMQKIARLIPTNAPLANGINIPLCRLWDIHNLMQDGAIVKSSIEMLIDSAHHDILVACPPYDPQFLKEIRTVPQYIKRLLDQRKYNEIVELGNTMNNDEFLRSICPVVRTLEQYNGIADYLKNRKLVASFYVHGDIEVVKETIITKSIVHGKYCYKRDNSALVFALPMALKQANHGRFVDLLNIRKEITAETDEQPKREGKATSFEIFVEKFLLELAPWDDVIALKRFLILCGDELRSKHPDILNTLCQELVHHTSSKLINPLAKKLLTDLIGQPLLLTPLAFINGLFRWVFLWGRSDLIKYSWREAVQEGLKVEHLNGGERLWDVIQRMYPGQFTGNYPSTADALTTALEYFPTKQRLEEEWAKENVMILYDKIKNFKPISYLFPEVLWFIIASYAISWTDV